jgi:hypothetical protein
VTAHIIVYFVYVMFNFWHVLPVFCLKIKHLRLWEVSHKHKHSNIEISNVRNPHRSIFLCEIIRGAAKSLAFPISYLQHNQKDFSRMS